MQPNTCSYLETKMYKLCLHDEPLHHGKHEKDSGDSHKLSTIHEFLTQFSG